MTKIATLSLFFLAILPLSVHAETVLRVGEDISVGADQVVDGDYYVSVGPFGDTSMSGSVMGDMYAFGANGSIHSDLTIVGGTTQLHATVTDDVRIIAGEITIADHIGGDLFVLGGVLKVLSTAQVDGDILFFGGDAEISGTVGGSVLGTSERIRIDAEVGKDVDIKTATALTLGENARIAGSVKYASTESLVRAQQASIEGEVVKNDYAVSSIAPEQHIRTLLIPLFIALFASLSLYLLFRTQLQQLVQNLFLHPLKNAAIGLSVAVLVPLLSIILILTVLGALIGFIGFFFAFLTYALAYAISGVVVGAFLARLFMKKLHLSRRQAHTYLFAIRNISDHDIKGNNWISVELHMLFTDEI